MIIKKPTIWLIIVDKAALSIFLNIPSKTIFKAILRIAAKLFALKITTVLCSTNNTLLRIIFTPKITDPNEYDTYLIEALAASLAADLAYAITNNATLAKNYEATADERLREARFIDATENSLGTVESSEFTDARL